MKKLIVTILAFVYMCTSIGATIHMHYCMGKMASWSLDFNTSKICGKCGMEKSDKKAIGCCKDEDKFIKNDSDQKTAETTIQFIQLGTEILPVSLIEISSVDILSVIEENPGNHTSHRKSSTPVYIFDCIYRI